MYMQVIGAEKWKLNTRNVARRTAEEAVLLVAERGGAGITASSVVMCVRQGE